MTPAVWPPIPDFGKAGSSDPPHRTASPAHIWRARRGSCTASPGARSRPHLSSAPIRGRYWCIRPASRQRWSTSTSLAGCWSAGADLSEFGTAPSPTTGRRVRFARDVWAALQAIEVPTIAMLHGFVLGSGLEMALFSDFRLAAEGTRFGLPEVQLGMIPAAGATQTLARVCGRAVALDLLLTSRRVGTAEAARLGLIWRSVPAEQLESETDTLAQQLASLDPAAVRAVRRAIREGSELPIEQALRLESRLAATLRPPA
ncbi:MAG: enoyl-CoA hydratase/isomerase family protein [Chloroflexi bacterium]|nr:enoyl-CoA hydratase/isomerase family protein [Chloroflexota bacterium]